MTCPTCKQDCDSIRTIKHKGELKTGCDNCLASQLVSGDGSSAKYYRNAQRADFRRDLTQPWQKEYAKAYPDKAREEWGDEMARKFS